MINQNNPDFQAVLQIIESTDDLQINQIIAAVNKRFQIQFPDWEVLYIACPKNSPEERKRTLDFLIDHFNRNT